MWHTPTPPSFAGTIMSHRAGTTQYEVKFHKKGRGRLKATRFFDLELPSTEKVSWWHLAGYEMWKGADESADEDEMEADKEQDEEQEIEEQEEEEEEMDMEEDE